MAFCPLCEKKFQDRRGLHGHFRFVHKIEYGSGKPAKKSILTEAIRDNIEKRKGKESSGDKLKERGNERVVTKKKGMREALRIKRNKENFGGDKGGEEEGRKREITIHFGEF